MYVEAVPHVPCGGAKSTHGSGRKEVTTGLSAGTRSHTGSHPTHARRSSVRYVGALDDRQ